MRSKKLLYIISIFFILISIIYLYLFKNSEYYSNIEGLFTTNARTKTCKCYGRVIETINPASDPSSNSSCDGITLPFSCQSKPVQ